MGRGPVWGIITRLTCAPASAGTLDATAGSAEGLGSVHAAEPAAIGGSAIAAGTDVGAAAAVAGCGTRGPAGVAEDAAETAAFVSCGALFAGTATAEDVPFKPAAGGFTITGPEGAREAMAGVDVGVVETICGACRGNGTILRGAGFAPAAALAGAALAGVPVGAGVPTAAPAAEDVAARAKTDGVSGPAAAAVTVGRGAAGTPRCIPCDSRCSFCC